MALRKITQELLVSEAPKGEIISADYTKAVSLHRRICANAQAAQESLYEMCKALKEMRDGKLYKELGYSNFEDYTETEVGISRYMAYKYTSIADMKNVESIQQIGVTKLAILAKLDESERTEIVQNTDLESTSVRELKEKIAELEADNKSKSESITELESQVEELENRPIEIAVQESHEVENMRKAMEKLNEDIGRQMSDLQDENIREVRRLNDKHNAEIQKLTDEHSKAIQTMAESHNAEMEKLSEEFEARIEEAKAQAAPGETVTVVDTKAIFKAYFSGAIDSINRLFSFMETAAQDENAQAYISKLFTLADMINDKTKKFKED